MSEMAQFVPLPDPWPDAPVCILGLLYPCPTGDCCSGKTDGDLCGHCTAKYERIANLLRPYIASDAAERAAYDTLRAEVAALRKALEDVLTSATPHPTQHPAMYAAWAAARKLLAPPPQNEEKAGE